MKKGKKQSSITTQHKIGPSSDLTQLKTLDPTFILSLRFSLLKMSSKIPSQIIWFPCPSTGIESISWPPSVELALELLVLVAPATWGTSVAWGTGEEVGEIGIETFVAMFSCLCMDLHCTEFFDCQGVQ